MPLDHCSANIDANGDAAALAHPFREVKVAGLRSGEVNVNSISLATAGAKSFGENAIVVAPVGPVRAAVWQVRLIGPHFVH